MGRRAVMTVLGVLMLSVGATCVLLSASGSVGWAQAATATPKQTPASTTTATPIATMAGDAELKRKQEAHHRKVQECLGEPTPTPRPTVSTAAPTPTAGSPPTPTATKDPERCVRAYFDSETFRPRDPKECLEISTPLYQQICKEKAEEYLAARKQIEEDEARRTLGKKISGTGTDNFRLQVGLVTLNPFSIQKHDNGTDMKPEDDFFTVESSDLSARGIVQATFSYRWPWERHERLRRAAYKQETDGGKPWRFDWLATETELEETSQAPGAQTTPTSNGCRVPSGLKEFLKPDDVEAKLGFSFGSNQKKASTIVGSGDLSLELYTGFNLWRAVHSSGMALGVNVPEMGVSLVTGRDVQDIHVAAFVGPSLVAGVPLGTDVLKSKSRLIRFRYRLGWAEFEAPDFEKNSDHVATEHGIPKFSPQWLGFANEAEFQLPVLETAYVTVSGRTYNGSDPNPWTFQIDYSIPIDTAVGKVVEGVGGALGLNE